MVKYPLAGMVRFVLLGLLAAPALALELTEADYLADPSFVLSASRLGQPIMDAPNAITVLDRATIAATGYHNLTDLFRLVPGIYVGQKKGWFHNVTHSLADEYARRMQVLVDGRSVYLASIGGVRWDTLPLAVDDIERIEVVRGPNAATFGANALTGVINIITRHPQDVEGRMLHWIGGDHAHQEGWFRWGAGNATANHRVTLGHREDDGYELQADDERSSIFNYRGDFTLDNVRSLSVQAGWLGGEREDGRRVIAPLTLRDAINQLHEQDERSLYLQGDYRQDLGDERQLAVKGFFSELLSDADVPVSPVIMPPNTTYSVTLASRRWHLEAQVNQQVEADLRLALGGFLRRDAVRSHHFYGVPDWINADSWGLFAHVEKRLATEWLLNLGAFWEDYAWVGGRLSPRIALNWQPTAYQTLRLGVSRAYRNPVVFESRGRWTYRFTDPLHTPIPDVVALVASGNVGPEEIVSHELSYYANWPEWGLALDGRLFQERIEGIIGFVPGAGPQLDVANLGSVNQMGSEWQVKWQPRSGTRILANYATLRIDNDLDGTRYSPRNLAGLHFMHSFPGGVDITLSHYWIGAFKAIGQGPIPRARRWDARIAKHLTLGATRAEVALGVLNGGGAYNDFDNGPENRFDTRGYAHLKLDF